MTVLAALDTWFLAPQRLWALLIVVALVVAAVAAGARRRRDQVRFSNLELLDRVAPRRPGWRRWVPAATVVASLCAGVVAIAQPVRVVEAPVEDATIVVALDTSLSMGATDVAPDRLSAAQSAATAFVDDVDPDVRVALVTFAGTATVAVPPTRDRAQLREAIDSIELSEATAIGDAIDTSLTVLDTAGVEGDAGAVVLLSDGGTTAGVPSAEAAQRAADAGVPVTTIAYGTPEGTIRLDEDGDGVAEDIPVPVDAAELANVADITGGAALSADTADELDSVFADLGSQLGVEPGTEEVTVVAAGVSFALLVAAAAMSLWWLGRLV